MNKLTIGLDFGSDSVRALLVDAVTGAELATSVHHYERWAKGSYCNPVSNQFRQHPLDYLEGLEITIKAVLARAPAGAAANVVGIGVDTTGSTPCAVDKHGIPLSMLPEFSDNPNAMFILWKDHTALNEAVEITQLAKKWGGEDFTKYEGGIYSSEWFWAKVLRTLRVDEKVRQAAFSWVEHCDWIPAVLTGNINPLTMKRSRCAAGHKAMWHQDWQGLPPEEFLVKLDPVLNGLRSRLYQNTDTAEVPAGTLSAEWAATLGLPATVVVSGGAFDCHMGAVGASIEPYQMVKVVGTSTCDIIVAPAVHTCVKGICGQVDGSVVPGLTGLEAGQSAFGDIYAWFKRFLSYGGEVNLAALEQDAAKLPVSEVLALDWMNGRRTPDANQHLTGAIFGLNLGTTAPMVYRALIESTAYGARRIAERFSDEGIPVKSVVAIGGIAKKSPFIMQLCADVLNMPIKVAKSEQACALGAAMFAATAAGVYKNVETAMAAMNSGFDAVYQPIPANAAVYEKYYARYLAYANAVEQEIMNHV
jgi:L-ribulokinase